jgi:hypothetical protein
MGATGPISRFSAWAVRRSSTRTTSSFSSPSQPAWRLRGFSGRFIKPQHWFQRRLHRRSRYQNPGGTAFRTVPRRVPVWISLRPICCARASFLTGTQVAHSENTLLSVTARKGPGVGSMAWAALRFLSRTRSEQRQCGFADSVITSIRTLAAASAEAADSPQLQHDLPILTKWLSVRLGQIGLAQLVQRPWARHRFLSARA